MITSRTTINDVAAHAGVSRSSVSRYLNGHRVRRAETIQASIGTLGYEPNPIARSLRSGRTRSVGVIVADVANPFFAAAFKGIEAEARREENGPADPVQLFLCNTGESDARLLEVLDGLAGRVDGLIVAALRESQPPPGLLQRVPVVLLDREFAGTPFSDAVVVDNAGGMAEAIAYLATFGHRRIGLISGPTDTTPGRGRLEGYRRGLSSCGLPWDERLTAYGDFGQRSGRTAAAKLLAVSSPPTAIVATNNLMALGALREIGERGLVLPDDLSFVGFDDFEAAGLMRPAISTISRPMQQQGAIAMRLLLARWRGEEGLPQRVVMPTQFIARGSCGPVPIATEGKL